MSSAATMIIGFEDDGPMTKADWIVLGVFVGIIGAIVAVGLLGIFCKCNCCGIPWLVGKIFKGIFWIIGTIFKTIFYIIGSILGVIAGTLYFIAKGTFNLGKWLHNKIEAGVRVVLCLPLKKKKVNDVDNNNNNDPEMGQVQHNEGFAEHAAGAGLLPNLNLQKPEPVVVAKPKAKPAKPIQPVRPSHAGIIAPRIAHLAVDRDIAYRAARRRSAGDLYDQDLVAAPNNNINNDDRVENRFALPESDDESESPPPLTDGDDDSLISTTARDDGRAHSL
ncbi:hypothetical protein Sste5346_004714 [Sporothrix stenoceras]|uniref:Uncharacterized protein n=1 Tax=Sporothrix stenoceras TaxID=5173 RepID=A0ABR3Z7K6_9PEZI